MKFNQIKLQNSVLFNGAQVTFLETAPTRHNCTAELKETYILVSSSKDTIIIPLTNVIYAKAEETNEIQKHSAKQLSAPAKS